MKTSNVTWLAIKRATVKFLKSHWPIIVGSIMLITLGAFTVLLEHYGARWSSRIHEVFFSVDARLDTRSRNCLDIAEGCVRDGKFPKAFGLIRVRAEEISQADLAIAFLNTVLHLCLHIHLCTMVPTEGVEPTHSYEYQILSLARLPIPPRRQPN
jgi:hypothetical protein